MLMSCVECLDRMEMRTPKNHYDTQQCEASTFAGSVCLDSLDVDNTPFNFIYSKHSSSSSAIRGQQLSKSEKSQLGLIKSEWESK